PVKQIIRTKSHMTTLEEFRITFIFLSFWIKYQLITGITVPILISFSSIFDKQAILLLNSFPMPNFIWNSQTYLKIADFATGKQSFFLSGLCCPSRRRKK